MKRILYILTLVLFTSCKVCEPCIPETIVRDSIQKEYILDSVFIHEHDSVARDRWRENDTVFVTVEKYITRYKENIRIERDTITLTNDVVKVQCVKYVPTFVKTMAWIGGVLLMLLLGRLIWWIYSKFSGLRS